MPVSIKTKKRSVKKSLHKSVKKPLRAAVLRSPTRHETSKTPSQPDAVSLLRADHTKIRELLVELKSAEKPAQRQRVLAQVKKELEVHTRIEEEIFYPAFRKAALTKKDEQLFHEATAEHHAADVILEEVGNADDATEEFPGRAKVLKEVVEHHAREEETDMFPRARSLIGATELQRLGQLMEARKRSLLSGYTGITGTLQDTGITSTLQMVANFVTSPFSGSKAAPDGRA